MSILITPETRLLVQGITGDAAQHHTKLMIDYGTHIVAGVRPGAGGQEVHGVSVFDSVKEAKKHLKKEKWNEYVETVENGKKVRVYSDLERR